MTMPKRWVARVVLLALAAGGAATAQSEGFDREAFRERLNSNWARGQELAWHENQGRWYRPATGRIDAEGPYFGLALQLDQSYRRWVYSQVTPRGGAQARSSQALDRQRFEDALRQEREGHSRMHPWPGRYRWN